VAIVAPLTVVPGIAVIITLAHTDPAPARVRVHLARDPARRRDVADPAGRGEVEDFT